MNEVEKMYENAGVEKEFEKPAECTKNPYITCDGCMLYDDKKGQCNNRKEYQPFTAEKQIGIIKWLLKSYDIGFSQLGQRIDTSLDGANCISGLGSGDTFEESLTQAINDLWQDLTEEERKQIKEILE